MRLNVYANGFPKTGNHGLVKACELLGIPAGVNHTPYAPHKDVVMEGKVVGKEEDPYFGLPADRTHHIHIKRDPRNVLISMIRFNNDPVTPGTFISRLRRFQDRTLVEEMGDFEPWLTDPNTLTVKFEDLIASDQCMRQIAEHVGVPYLDGAWERLPGRTFTWNDVHSDFWQLWRGSVISAWEDEGGNELLERWGYLPAREKSNVGTVGIGAGI